MADPRKSARNVGEFIGSAMVAGASYGLDHTILHLQTSTGEHIDYRVGDVPDPGGMAEFELGNLRALSVKIQQGGRRCSVVALAADGPRAFSVVLGTALALQKSGVHAVVDGGISIGVPCSVQK